MPRSRYVLFTTLAILGCAADLVTKAWVFAIPALRAGQTLWWWPGHVGIELSRNWGALFGIGQDMVWLFASLSIVAAVAIPVWLFRYNAARDLWVTIALGLVMGGVLGNLYDRLGLSAETWMPRGETRNAVHAVRDWVLWQINDERRWPNFNVADSLLVVGVGLLFFRLVREPRDNEPQPGKPQPGASGSGSKSTELIL
ncbi:MAG: signal peptidase II [Pirellulales bacterium]